MALTFRRDGTFTIVQLTDIHWSDGGLEDMESRALMETVLELEHPDLVVLTGDVIEGGSFADQAAAWRQCVQPFGDRKIPWAAVFGNHDDEGSLSRAGLMEVQRSCPGCLSEPGPTEAPGCGNYVLPIGSGSGSVEPGAFLYFLDSGSYAPAAIGGYDWIRWEQIDWYRRVSAEINPEMRPALAFFHIPVPEYNQVWNEQLCLGSKYEAVCCPAINSGFFAALVERGDVIGTFVGHDHVNDFEGTLHGIRLCYGRASGYHTYGREGFLRGARVIRLREGVRGFETWLRLADGAVPVDDPRRGT